MSIDTLGYETRTAAVIALRSQGLTTRTIAAKIGIEPKTVAALECSAARRKRSPEATSRPQVSSIDLPTRSLLRPHAARRGLSVDALIREIVSTVAEANLVDAVLDDQGGRL